MAFVCGVYPGRKAAVIRGRWGLRAAGRAGVAG